MIYFLFGVASCGVGSSRRPGHGHRGTRGAEGISTEGVEHDVLSTKKAAEILSHVCRNMMDVQIY